VKTLWRHYAARFARAFVAALLILTLLVIAVDTLLELDEIPEDERTLAAAAVRVGLRTLAQYLAYLVPAASFAAAFACVAQGARAREIIALKAGGVNPLIALLPVFAGALAVGLALGVVQESAGVQAAAVLAEKTGERDGRLMRSGVIWYQAGRVIYSAREADAEGNRLREVQILQRDEQGRLERHIQAARAERLTPQRWSFEDAVVRTFDPEDPSAAPRYERAEQRTLELPADRAPRLDPAELAALPLEAIAEYVSAVQAAGGSAGPARVVLHERATAPILALLLAALAVPLALGIERSGGLAFAAFQGVMWVAAFLFLRGAGVTVGSSGGVLAVIMPWGSLALFSCFAALMLVRSPR
jgi:lipopolysaccharide export system permease protein